MAHSLQEDWGLVCPVALGDISRYACVSDHGWFSHEHPGGYIMIGRIRSFFSQSRSLDRILEYKSYRGRLLRLETLEDRKMLAIDSLMLGASYDGSFFNNGPSATSIQTVGMSSSNTSSGLSDGGRDPIVLNFQFDDGDRWSATATDGGGLGQGDPTTLTWSIVPDGTQTPASSFDDNGGGAGPSDLIAFLDGIRGAGGGGADLTNRPWFQVFVDAFDRLSEVSGLTYVYEPADDGVDLNSAAGSLGVRGDVRIAGRFVDGQPAGGSTLAYNAFPNDSDMVIDTGNINFYSNTANNSLSFRNTLMHEAGHGIGLSHVLPVDQTKLMEPTITTNFDGPQFDDIIAMHRGYGDVLEKNGGNDSTGSATNLGALSPGTMITLGADGGPDAVIAPGDVDFLSIDDDSDEDVFQFQLVAGAGLKVMLTPVGPTYLQGPQGSDDDPPPAPTSFDASMQSDLALEILNSGGSVVASADANGLGGVEIIDNFVAAAGGVYFVRVTGDDNAAQLYQLDLITSDQFEPNNTLATATVLGSLPAITLQNLSIHNEADQDFYKITANKTGKLIVNAFFEHAVGDIDIQIQDSAGNVIASSVSVSDNEQIIIPVVGQQMYFLRVFGVGDGVMNTYDLEIENFPAPAPAFVDLMASSDTGMMNNDNITSDTTPTFLIQADLADFRDMGITLLNQSVIDPNNNGNASDATDDGAGVYVSLINLTTGALVQGFANQLGPTGILWTFTVPGISALTQADWFVSAAVQIVDGQQDPNRSTGRAQLSDPLIVTIETGDQMNASLPDLLAASDSGMFDDDNVTNKMSPAFVGVAPANYKVRLYANGELVGQSVVGSDSSDVSVGGVGGLGGANNDGLGLWEITSEPLDDGIYEITAEFEDAAGNVFSTTDLLGPNEQPLEQLVIEIDTNQPNTPFLDLLATDDTGRNNIDNTTFDQTPRLDAVVDDPNGPDVSATYPNGHLFAENIKYRIYDRFDTQPEALIFNQATFVANGGYQNLVALINQDGTHGLKLEVEDRAGNLSHDYLLNIELDRVAPPVSFGLPGVDGDGLIDLTDTGNTSNPVTFTDRITSDGTPRLWGQAEADSIVKVFVDINSNGMIDPGVDVFLGQDTAIPLNGNQAEPDGYWEIDVIVDLDDPLFFTPGGGLRSLLVSAEDLAGNVNNPNDGIPVDPDQQLDIFIDRQGPQVAAVTITDDPTTLVDESNYDLFDPKPSVNGPTPLIRSIDIDIVDFPDRLAADFLYDALEESVALALGNYSVVGDHVGNIAIESVSIVDTNVADGLPATATVRITFVDYLPDDRFTLTINDGIVDPVGNRLDGESNAAQPLEDPFFPSGDGLPGGDFVARFTIDSRPEPGTFVAQNISIDINGNTVWDPANGQIGNDATNVDLSFTLPVADPVTGAVAPGGYNVHDLVFVGKFAPIQGLIVGDDAVCISDVSGSTGSGFGCDAVGDQNGDGTANTILDAEIAAFKALNQELIDRGLGNTAQVAIVAFASSANSLDMDPIAPGIQLTTTPLADANSNGMRDVDEILMSLNDGGGTNYEAALTTATTAVNAIASPNTNVIFLSDGAPNSPGAHADEAAVLQGLGTNLRAFGVGPGAPLAQLLIIDPAAESFANTNELLDAFGGGGMMPAGDASGFDQLAAYGNSAELGSFRWLIDTNSDGVINTGDGDILSLQPLQAGFNVAAAIPLAGDFDQNPDNGDEIALYKSTNIGGVLFGVWIFDTDRDFVIETNGDDTIVTGTLLGHPIVGDFDGDGLDDLGVFNNNQWFFDLANDGLGTSNTGAFGAAAAGGDRDDTLIWGFPGVLDRPVSADMDQDGIDDIGLWIPRDSSATPPRLSEWYFLISDDHIIPDVGGNRITGQINTLDHAFKTVPFGKDLYFEFGDDLALPIVGNFDPPVASPSISPQGGMEGDYDDDGDVDGRDFLVWQRNYGSTEFLAADGNRNNVVDSGDLEMWEDNYSNSNSNALLAGSGDNESSSLVASLSVVTLEMSSISLATANESTLNSQTRESSLAQFWLSLPERESTIAEGNYFESMAETQIEQSRIEQDRFAVYRVAEQSERSAFDTGENETDEEFELVLDEAFAELGS